MPSDDWQKSNSEKAENETATFIYTYKGAAIMYGFCDWCGQPFQYPTDRKYWYCPYCKSRLVDEKEEKK